MKNILCTELVANSFNLKTPIYPMHFAPFHLHKLTAVSRSWLNTDVLKF